MSVEGPSDEDRRGDGTHLVPLSGKLIVGDTMHLLNLLHTLLIHSKNSAELSLDDFGVGGSCSSSLPGDPFPPLDDIRVIILDSDDSDDEAEGYLCR